MNGWVEQNTNGNIKKLIEPPINEATVMFLLNAIYLKAPWKVSFDPKATRNGTFTTAGGLETQAKFMSSKEGNYGFLDDNVMAMRMSYASGRIEMVAIMPQQQSLGDFVMGLTTDKLQSYIDQCKETSMSLLFPKFKTEYKATLNDALKAMGMEEAFGPSAEFKNMSASMGSNLVITEVKHKSFIEVDEAGTEASAATSVEIAATAMPMALEFIKPFIYLIRDTKTGAILFIGTMEDPT